MRFFRFDPFEHFSREELTVSALRARAKDKGVDISTKSSEGSRPVEDDTRPVTSGDMMKMFAAHAEKDTQEADT